jgi:hypothetical protein
VTVVIRHEVRAIGNEHVADLRLVDPRAIVSESIVETSFDATGSPGA